MCQYSLPLEMYCRQLLDALGGMVIRLNGKKVLTVFYFLETHPLAARE